MAAALPSCPLVRPSGRCPGGPCSIRVCTLQFSRMGHKKLVIFSCLCPIKSVVQMVPQGGVGPVPVETKFLKGGLPPATKGVVTSCSLFSSPHSAAPPPLPTVPPARRTSWPILPVPSLHIHTWASHLLLSWRLLAILGDRPPVPPSSGYPDPRAGLLTPPSVPPLEIVCVGHNTSHIVLELMCVCGRFLHWAELPTSRAVVARTSSPHILASSQHSDAGMNRLPPISM